MSLFNVSALSVTYGGLKAVSDVTLEVEPGEIVGLIGPNGAGKTSFIDAVSGFTSYTGAVRLNGRSLDDEGAARRASSGLGRTWQTADVFDELTVYENLRVAAVRPSVRTTMKELLTGRLAPAPSVATALALVGLEDLAESKPDGLSQGQRKLVDVARALAGQPTVVCLDEPAAGLDTDESQALGRRLRAVADSGTAILLVDHDMGLVLGVCDRIYVLDFGKLIASGTADEIRNNAVVLEAYLGGAEKTPPSESELSSLEVEKPS